MPKEMKTKEPGTSLQTPARTTSRVASRHTRSSSSQNTPSEEDWKFSNINWKYVWGSQQYGTLFLTFFIGVSLILLQGVYDEKPQGSEIEQVLDSGLFGYKWKKESFPYPVAVIVPLVIFLVKLFAVEIYMMRGVHNNISEAVYTIVYFVMDWGCAYIVQLFTREVSAIAVAEPRPDFVERCKLNAHNQCSQNASDAFASFFSGHVSSAMVTAIYSSVYFLWSMYFRAQRSKTFLGRKEKSRFLCERHTGGGGFTGLDWCVHQIGHAAVMYGILVQLAFGWFVGVSRVVDNRNHIWDVNTGCVVAAFVAVPFSMHAIGLLKYMPKNLPKEHVQATTMKRRTNVQSSSGV